LLQEIRMIVTIYGHDYELNINQKLRTNFTLKELANTSGNPKLPQFVIDEYSDKFLDMLQEFRVWYNKSMVINSCYRQTGFNATVGGDFRSAHLHACAVDWQIKNHTDVQRANVTKKWQELCNKHNVIGAINYYKNGYHLEAYTDKWYGSKSFQIRDYRGTSSDW